MRTCSALSLNLAIGLLLAGCSQPTASGVETPPGQGEDPAAAQPMQAQPTAEPTGQPPGPIADPPPRDPSLPPGVGIRQLGEPCTVSDRCAQNLGCSGLYYKESGVCIEAAKAKAQCETKGDRWGTWGMMQASYCMPVLPDGGKACTDNGQCEGQCIAEEDGSGKCQELKSHFGCYSTMTAGKPGHKMCMD